MRLPAPLGSCAAPGPAGTMARQEHNTTQAAHDARAPRDLGRRGKRCGSGLRPRRESALQDKEVHMRSIFQMDKVHNIFCINGIAAHIFDGWRWVGGGRRIAFPSICPYGFHTRGGSRPYRVAETPAEAFLTTAQQYHLAATTLL